MKKQPDGVDIPNPPANIPHVDRTMLDEHLKRAAHDPEGELALLCGDDALTAALWPLRTALEREAGNKWRCPWEVEAVATDVVGRLAAIRAAAGVPARRLPDTTLAHWKRLAAPPASLPLNAYVSARIEERIRERGGRAQARAATQ
ncbi:MAG: hypothetical protein OXG72_08160 [Acidobacteria bacterium]|nr:hypothetical protein [Acidobacteriota bacterium]